MSTYKKKTWVNNETRVNATNMNHIEEGIYQNANDIEELKQEKNFLEITSEDFTVEGDKIIFKSDIAKEIMGMNKRIKADYSFVESGLSQGQFIAVLAPRAIIDYSSDQDSPVVYEYSTTNWLLDSYRTTYVEFLFDKNTKQLYLYSNHPAINHDQIVGFDREWSSSIRLTTNGDFSESTINPLQINELSTISFHDTPKLQFNANDKNELESVEFKQDGYSADFTYTIPKGAKHYVVNELPTTDIDTTGNYYVMTESVDGRSFLSTDISNLSQSEYPSSNPNVLRQNAVVNSNDFTQLQMNHIDSGNGYMGDFAIKFNIPCEVTVTVKPRQSSMAFMYIDVNGVNVELVNANITETYTRNFNVGETLCVRGANFNTSSNMYYKLAIQPYTIDGKIPLSTKVDEYINYENLWFKNGGGSSVIANPTLSGDEETLNGLEVDGTKYTVGGGSEVHLYRHHLSITTYGQDAFIDFDTISTKSEPYTTSTLRNLGKMICTNIPTIENSSNQSNLSWFTNVTIGSSDNFSFSRYILTFNKDGTVKRGFNTGQQYQLKTLSDTVTEVE